MTCFLLEGVSRLSVALKSTANLRSHVTSVIDRLIRVRNRNLHAVLLSRRLHVTQTNNVQLVSRVIQSVILLLSNTSRLKCGTHTICVKGR